MNLHDALVRYRYTSYFYAVLGGGFALALGSTLLPTEVEFTLGIATLVGVLAWIRAAEPAKEDGKRA